MSFAEAFADDSAASRSAKSRSRVQKEARWKSERGMPNSASSPCRAAMIDFCSARTHRCACRITQPLQYLVCQDGVLCRSLTLLITASILIALRKLLHKQQRCVLCLATSRLSWMRLSSGGQMLYELLFQHATIREGKSISLPGNTKGAVVVLSILRCIASDDHSQHRYLKPLLVWSASIASMTMHVDKLIGNTLESRQQQLQPQF